ncbi:MAG TPA: acylphosphatase, partial [Candidatus Dormibacteraeota bacterium]
HGDVQGVGFRDFVWRRAERLGLAGWVRNRPDGSVECVAEGSRSAVDALVESLRRGPWGARVDNLELRTEEPRGEVAPMRVTA